MVKTLDKCKFMVRFANIIIMVFVFAGCANHLSEKEHSAPNIKQNDPLIEKAKNNNQKNAVSMSYMDEHVGKSISGLSHLAQCKRDLESLYRISPSEYARYRDEYDALMSSSASFMAVSGDISDEVSNLARPRFQFALVNLCYRIKNALAQTLISQAGGEGAR